MLELIRLFVQEFFSSLHDYVAGATKPCNEKVLIQKVLSSVYLWLYFHPLWFFIYIYIYIYREREREREREGIQKK